MKHSYRRTAWALAMIILLMSCVMALAPVTVLAEAESTATHSSTIYSADANSGQRDVVCNTLDGTGSAAYYTGTYTYEDLSALESGELLVSLRTLMTDTHKTKTSYNNCRDYAVKTDCQNSDGSVSLLYTGYTAQMSDYIGSGRLGWNREHVWPQSLGGFKTSGAGSDLHHVRPDDSKTNADRGNLKYGDVSSGSDVAGSSLVGGMVGGTRDSSYFEPLDNVKGDVARICLYVYARYGTQYDKCADITNVFQSVDVLLEWCALDPVDTWEMGRNEVVGAIQGNRNVFIDYPEYAWLIFDRKVPTNMVTPSGMAMSQVEGAESATESETETTPPSDVTSDNQFVGASVTLGIDLTMKYYASVDDGTVDANQTLATRCTMNGNTVIIKAGEKNADGYYIFAFTGITPQCMGDEIIAELVILDADDNVVSILSTKSEYSVKVNAQSLLTNNADNTALVTTVSDMLAYGEAAQIYTGYNTDVLITSDVTGMNPSTALPTASDNVTKLTSSDSVAGSGFRTAYLFFSNYNRIRIGLMAQSEITVVIKKDGVTVGEQTFAISASTQYLDTDPIYATEFADTYTFEMYEGDTLMQTLTYSVNSYLYNNMNKTDTSTGELTSMASLARALYRYGASCLAYRG